MRNGRAGGLIFLGGLMFFVERTRIAELAAQSRLPAIYGAKENVEAGGLMAYGPNLRESYRRAATYVDKILKGAKPAELPIERHDQVRTRDQHEDCEGPRSHHPAIGAGAGRSGH